MNIKIFKILQLTTVNVTLLFASECAYGGYIHVCADKFWGKTCEYDNMGVMWVNAEFADICQRLGGIDITLEVQNRGLYNGIINDPKCERKGN